MDSLAPLLWSWKNKRHFWPCATLENQSNWFSEVQNTEIFVLIWSVICTLLSEVGQYSVAILYLFIYLHTLSHRYQISSDLHRMLERSQCCKNIFCTQTPSIWKDWWLNSRVLNWSLNTYLTTFTFSTHQSPCDVCQNTMMAKLKHTKNIW